MQSGMLHTHTLPFWAQRVRSIPCPFDIVLDDEQKENNCFTVALFFEENQQENAAAAAVPPHDHDTHPPIRLSMSMNHTMAQHIICVRLLLVHD